MDVSSSVQRTGHSEIYCIYCFYLRHNIAFHSFKCLKKRQIYCIIKNSFIIISSVQSSSVDCSIYDIFVLFRHMYTCNTNHFILNDYFLFTNTITQFLLSKLLYFLPVPFPNISSLRLVSSSPPPFSHSPSTHILQDSSKL